MSDSEPRVVAGRYRLVRKLGQGGMGRVWAAHDELLDRDVALKELLLPRSISDEEVADLRERTLREARAIARLAHPNIVRFFDVVQDRDLPWIVMELVPSRSLHELIVQDGPIAPDRAARIGLGLLAALRAAHAQGVLHRDVKPANVLIGDDDRVVLTDFGLVSLAGDSGMTATGMVMGSPSFMAPEQALDRAIAPSDLWSMGATLYHAIEGQPPYQRSSPTSTLAALATEPPRPPRRAGVLGAVLGGLLEKDPARRIDAATAEQWLRVAAGIRVAGPLPPLPAPPRRRPRHSLLVTGALALVAAVAAVLVFHPFGLLTAEKAQASGVDLPLRPSATPSARPTPSAAVAVVASPSPTTPTPSVSPAKLATTGPATPRPTVKQTPKAGPNLSKFATVYYQSQANNLWVTADDAGASPLIAFPETPGAWETFDEIDLGNGDIALRAEINNKFVTATATGPLVAHSAKVTAAETFTLVFNADGSVSFRAHSNGKYVTVPAGTAKPLINSKTTIGTTEKFNRSVIGQSG